MSTRDAQRLTIQAQAEEMVSLTKEVAQLKEDCFALTRRVHMHICLTFAYACGIKEIKFYLISLSMNHEYQVVVLMAVC